MPPLGTVPGGLPWLPALQGPPGPAGLPPGAPAWGCCWELGAGALLGELGRRDVAMKRPDRVAPISRARLLRTSSQRAVIPAADHCLWEARVPCRGQPGHSHTRFRAGGWLGAVPRRGSTDRSPVPAPGPCLPKTPSSRSIPCMSPAMDCHGVPTERGWSAQCGGFCLQTSASDSF